MKKVFSISAFLLLFICTSVFSAGCGDLKILVKNESNNTYNVSAAHLANADAEIRKSVLQPNDTSDVYINGTGRHGRQFAVYFINQKNPSNRFEVGTTESYDQCFFSVPDIKMAVKPAGGVQITGWDYTHGTWPSTPGELHFIVNQN